MKLMLSKLSFLISFMFLTVFLYFTLIGIDRLVENYSRVSNHTVMLKLLAFAGWAYIWQSMVYYRRMIRILQETHPLEEASRS
jgi:hypothetical protein